MPQYLFQNEQTGEIKEIIQSVNDTHEYSENGEKWSRIWTIPNTAINTMVDPFSEQSFLSSTDNKKETIGSLLDRSKEASEKREKIAGIDKNKEKYFDNYSKTRKGAIHPELRKKKAKEDLKKMGVTLEN